MTSTDPSMSTASPTATATVPTAAPSQPIHHVAVKPPIFSVDTAASWFQILEAQLHLAHVTNCTTQFYHAIAALPPEVINTLSPAILDAKDFQTLKSAVLSEHEKTKPELFEKLIAATTMCGRPSAFLTDIQRTAEKLGIGEELVRHKFLQALPTTIAPVIASQKTLSLAQLGVLADELLTFSKQSVFAVKQAPTSSHNYQPQAARQSNQPGLQPFSPGQRPQVCRAHIFFAGRARTCKPWCKWPDKTNCSIRPSSRPPSRSSSPAPKHPGNQ